MAREGRRPKRPRQRRPAGHGGAAKSGGTCAARELLLGGFACEVYETRPENGVRLSWRLFGVRHGGCARIVCFARCRRAASRAETRYPRKRRGAVSADGQRHGLRDPVFTPPKEQRRSVERRAEPAGGGRRRVAVSRAAQASLSFLTPAR